MDNFVRIGHMIVPMERIRGIALPDLDNPTDSLIVALDTDVISLTRHESPEEYDTLLRVGLKSETLASKLAKQTVYQWDSENFDPFLDPLPPALFTAFQSLPNADDYVLSLLADGKGAVFSRGELERKKSTALISWDSPNEGLNRLEAYRDELTREQDDSDEDDMHRCDDGHNWTRKPQEDGSYLSICVDCGKVEEDDLP